MKEMDFIGKCLLIKDEGKKILVIGDLHLGYEGALRETGVFVGDEMLKEYKSYLDEVFEKIGKIDEIVLLGDVKHVIGSVIKQEWNEVLAFLDYLIEKTKRIVIVKGQHDALLEGIVRKREGIELRDYYLTGRYAFMHGDKDYDEINVKEIKYWIMGNAHPAIKISDDVKIEKYKCFLVGKYRVKMGNVKEIVIVPSFIYANEGSDVRENDYGMAWNFDYGKFRVIVVGENLEDLDFGELKKIG